MTCTRKKAAVTGCSNGQRKETAYVYEQLRALLLEAGWDPQFSECIFLNEHGETRSAKERADALMEMYKNPEVSAVFDVSGGDLANTVLPHLDFEVIRKYPKELWGYSDLTVLLNAIYTMTGNTGVLYQIRNLAGEYSVIQMERFMNSNELFEIEAEFVQQTEMSGIAAGGNIRCFLKLAGTPYFPDLSGKILVLEAFHGRQEQVETYYAQLHAMGAFDKAAGILLGTFTQLDEEKDEMLKYRLLKPYIRKEMPVAVTHDIGHGKDAKALRIGGYYEFRE